MFRKYPVKNLWYVLAVVFFICLIAGAMKAFFQVTFIIVLSLLVLRVWDIIKPDFKKDIVDVVSDVQSELRSRRTHVRQGSRTIKTRRKTANN